MKQIHIKRLEKLGNHLLWGELDHEVFDFQVFNDGCTKPGTCGTRGCALGECPKVFPRDWRFHIRSDDSPQLRQKLTRRESAAGHTFGSALKFFSLTSSDAAKLFYPGGTGEGARLNGSATRYQVGRAILDFARAAVKKNKKG